MNSETELTEKSYRKMYFGREKIHERAYGV
jgi:hypothetical protein